MTQIEALENAWASLKSHAASGNDDAGEALPVITRMLETLIMRYARRKEMRKLPPVPSLPTFNAHGDNDE